MKEEIEEKLERLEKRVSSLEQHSNVSLEELEEEALVRDAVERNFQVALEIVLDICSMIVAYEDMEKPDSYRKMIESLGEHEILPEEFAERFEGAAGFRNILVHQYADVDPDRLHRYLTDDLEDFDTFVRHVSRYARELEE